ncbi:MAG: hybrid sensor histidine kinase/response regulator, partial [Bacteroidales bacterium]|nr:hybrid sensor histidine kinase/response regulator [Bacteroidales bacterium]
MKKYALLFVIFLSFPVAHAYTFKKYQVNNGLSENTVQVITQDHLGFMWFGTKDGLNRFDGHEYQIYKNIPGDTTSLGNNFIRSIYQDEHHNLWIGTDNHIYIFDYLTEQFKPFFVKSDLGAVIHSGISAICPENDSLLWIGSLRQGAFCYNKTNGKLRQYLPGKTSRSIGSNVIWRIYCDYSGTIWLGTREGLSRYNRETDSFHTYTVQNTGGNLSNDEILSIYEDTEGNLWIGTWSGGIAKLNRSSDTFESYLNRAAPPFVSHIRAIIEVDQSTLMVGADDGLYLLNKKTGLSSRMDDPKDFNSLGDQNVYSIYRDHEEGIWIGTYFGGVNYMSPNGNIIEHHYQNFSEHTLSGKAISQFCEDKSGNLWIATEDAGLNYFDTKTKKFKVYLPQKGRNSLSYHNLHTLALDGDRLWIGTFSRGIDVLDLKTGLFRNYFHSKTDTTTINDECVFALYKDSKGDIYVGTPFGLCRYDRKYDNFVRIPEVPVFVYDIKEDRHGFLWVASYSDGAYRFEYKTGKWKNYPYKPGDRKGIAFKKLTCVYPDEKQRLWFATEGGGICKYNYETDDFTTFNEQDGLPNNVVYTILDDKYGNLWLSSNNGISKLNPLTKELTTYKREDGLQGNQFNYRSGYKTKDGIFYFGGINGFNAFDPDKLTHNKHKPPVVISLFEILSEENPLKLPVRERIELKYNQSSFRIKFVSLSFQAQEKNLYVYQMEGLDDKWTNIGNQRTVSFINLQPGKYVFRVKGSNNDGVWNEEGAAIEILILPPFWRTTAAYIVYLCILLLLIYFSVCYLKRRLKEKEHRNIERINKEKEKEIYDSKINFFTNIAHEIRTPVSLIKAPLECILNSDDGNADTKGNLEVISRNTDRLLELINQLLDFRKIEEQSYRLNFTKVELGKLLDDICFRFRPAAESKG